MFCVLSFGEVTFHPEFFVWRAKADGRWERRGALETAGPDGVQMHLDPCAASAPHPCVLRRDCPEEAALTPAHTCVSGGVPAHLQDFLF